MNHSFSEWVYTREVNEDTPVCFAISTDNESLLDLLLNNGADVNIPRIEGYQFCEIELQPCPPLRSMRQGPQPQPDLADISQSGPTFAVVKEHPLHMALVNGNNTLAGKLIAKTETDLMCEHKPSHQSMGPWEAYIGETPIATAARTGNVEMVKALLEEQKRRGGYKALREMVNHGEKANPLFMTLTRAMDKQRLLIAAYLLRSGADVNFVNRYVERQPTALHLSQIFRWKEMSELLERMNADFDLPDVDGKTASQLAKCGPSPVDQACFAENLKDKSLVKSLTELTLESVKAESGLKKDEEQIRYAAATESEPECVESMVTMVIDKKQQVVSERQQAYLNALISRLEEEINN
ncbi:ankyrin [Elysia marginata]|uniref:Ankyrin n=1 Tax=Elysia marginata TaxID=1093978 RepID=A0AAV4IXE3_9GAST|nr:ankyrin [Elysia marginata]